MRVAYVGFILYIWTWKLSRQTQVIDSQKVIFLVDFLIRTPWGFIEW